MTWNGRFMIILDGPLQVVNTVVVFLLGTEECDSGVTTTTTAIFDLNALQQRMHGNL